MALIDKLRFHNILTQGGLPEAPAVDFADALQETFDEQIGTLASKADMERILERMDARFARVDDQFERMDERFAQFEAQMAQMEKRFEARMTQLETQFEARTAQMEKQFEARMTQMEKQFEAQMNARFAQSERDAAEREARQTRLFLIGIGITLTAITLATSLIIALT